MAKPSKKKRKAETFKEDIKGAEGPGDIEPHDGETKRAKKRRSKSENYDDSPVKERKRKKRKEDGNLSLSPVLPNPSIDESLTGKDRSGASPILSEPFLTYKTKFKQPFHMLTLA